MGVQVSNNKRVSASGNTLIYRLSDETGNTVKIYEVPLESAQDFQSTITSEKATLEAQTGKTLTLTKVERVF